ncbi:acyl-CoA dehydrogenase family protein [Streptomyces sp. NPDC003832]
MTFTPLPPDVAELRERTRRFIREVVIDAEPAPGGRLEPATRVRLQAAAKEAGVFAPHVPKEYGGQGVPIGHWSPITASPRSASPFAGRVHVHGDGTGRVRKRSA